MKKRVTKILLLIFGVLLAGLLIWNLTDCATVSIDGQTAEISFANSWKLRTALIPKEIHFDGAGCPFYTDYAFRIGGLTYCIATDGCETIWVKELNTYFSASKDKYTELDAQMLEHWSSKIRPAVSKYTFATFEKQGENGYKLIDSEISSLYTFDSLRIRPALEWAFEGDWLYRIVLNPGQEEELEILFGEKNLSINGKVCTTAEGVSYEDVLKWVSGKYQYFDYELQSKSDSENLIDIVQ